MFLRNATRIAMPAAARMAARRFTAATRSTAVRRGAFVAAGVASTTALVCANVAFANNAVNVDDVSKAIAAYIEENEDMGPTLVRLAWHSSGTYDVKTNTGGSDGGTIRFRPELGHGANAGLDKAVSDLKKINEAFPSLSWADLITLSGAVAIEAMGGPKIGFRTGRVDAKDGSACAPDGRLPDADLGTPGKTIQHIRDIFYRQGFNDQEIVALAGAHALGRCHRNASGYVGPWTRAPTTFSNEYFRELMENTWTVKVQDSKFPEQWEDPSGDLMMLPADMALVWDKKFRHWVEIYAKDEERFFKDFAAAFQKLEENGVKAFQKRGWW